LPRLVTSKQRKGYVKMKDTSNLATYYFHQGTNFSAYKYLGCSRKTKRGRFIYTFRVWAPSCDKIGVVSDVFGWDTPIYMTKITDKGIWECSYESDVSLEGVPYKYRIERNGRVFLKGDPYAVFSRGGADGASIIHTKTDYKWNDTAWRAARKRRIRSKNGSYLPTPINVYEVHFGSFMRHKEDNRYYTYREMAEILPGYLKYMGYTHVEFLPLAEHPFDGSWGYQVCAFYAPTSRFGTPEDFKFLIDTLHSNGIGVIMDWVPAHFPKDAWGLYEFDGSPLYEYQGEDRMESESWGTRFFDLGREEVQSFLISNALYFLREFHIDGLRVDAVASMIYLDYDRSPGKWIPNQFGTRENLEATAFLRKLNTAVFAEFPDVLMIAEESGSFVGITHPVSCGGLGFNLKWNMGWANDFYDYLLTDPLARTHKHTALNFPIMYAFSENYLMPISHDEVVHGKLSFINKMYGSYEDKFRQARSALLLMMSYPGKKLLFMGTEYAQFREWDFENSLEWFMLDYPLHRAFREYTAALNRFYLENSELWEIDFDLRGFEWILADEKDKNLIAYRRIDTKGNKITIVINFSGVEQTATIKTNAAKRLRCIFDTDGSAKKEIQVTKIGEDNFADITLAAFCGAVYREENFNKQINIRRN